MFPRQSFNGAGSLVLGQLPSGCCSGSLTVQLCSLHGEVCISGIDYTSGKHDAFQVLES